MQDVEQGEPQSQVLFRVTFLQCITLARQTLHHKSATYQQRHHEAARLPDLRRGGRLRGPPALPRGLPAGSAPESRPRPAPDDGGGTALEETSVMPAVAAVRGITPVEPLPSRCPAAAAASGITPDRPRPSSPSRAAARPPPRRAGSPPPGPIRPDGRGRPGPDPLERHGERYGASVRCRRRGRQRSPRPGPRADIPGRTGRGGRP